jgi:endo-1,4-beta-D-glucanase Y
MRPAIATAGAALALGAAAVAALAFSGNGTKSPRDRANASAERFLDGYVDGDGRVVRRDQGGDTVSEGQAYALLLAVARGDARRFDRVWNWTRTHLLRDDGLLAWHWSGGRVVDPQPAADADLDAARALALAARRFRRPGYRAAARQLGAAILRNETVQSGGDPVLVAGPWARGPRTINPSYFSPRSYGVLGRDPRWRGMARSSTRLARKLTRTGLPPDWAHLAPYGVAPMAAPRTGEPPRYGYDAIRLPLRFAESCNRANRAVAASLWPRLRTAPGTPVRGLDGSPQAGAEGAPALTASAAAAWAAGDRRAARKLLNRAEAKEADHRTYYGSAWVALARTMLQTRALGGC